MSKLYKIEGFRIHPKAAIILVIIAILSGLFGHFSRELGLDEFAKHISFSVSLICGLTFVLPSLKIWQVTTKE